jgi:hypothetical protein
LRLRLCQRIRLCRTQSLTRGEPGPGARINLTHDIEQALGLFLRVEISHVQTKALTAFFAPAGHEKNKPLEPRMLGPRQRHRRGGGAQIDDEKISGRSGRRGIAARFREDWPIELSDLLHALFPCRSNRAAASGSCNEAVTRAPRRLSCVLARWQPRYPYMLRDRWLCVPALRQVCPSSAECDSLGLCVKAEVQVEFTLARKSRRSELILSNARDFFCDASPRRAANRAQPACAQRADPSLRSPCRGAPARSLVQYRNRARAEIRADRASRRLQR